MKAKERAVRKSKSRATAVHAARPRPAARTVTVIAAPQQYTGSKEIMLLSRILNREESERLSEDAVLFTSLLSNLTPSLSDVSRRAGIYAGRQLYSILSSGKRYLFYEESVPDLVKFFEHAGYTRITYNVFPDRVDLNMYDRSHEYIGMDLHSFEAGLMSGFLTAAKRQYVDVTEHACSNNGSEFCKFTSQHDPFRTQAQRDAKASILRFVEHVASKADQGEKKRDIRISPEYNMLAMTAVLDRPYQEEMRHVASYIGSEISAKLFPNERTLKAGNAVAKIERVIRILNLGEASVKSLDPVRIEISFTRLHSRNELVELSLALINGLLKNHQVEGANVSSETRNGAYFVKITGKKGSK